MGCNFIRCNPGCGKTFCYGCGKPWEDDSDGTHHRNAHMNCNSYKEKKGKDAEYKENFYEKANFYYNKFKDCDRSSKYITDWQNK
jgi:hypothetical protein